MGTKSKRAPIDLSLVPAHKFLKFSIVSTATGINKDKIYNNLKGLYNSLEPEQVSLIAGILIPKITEVFRNLGYDTKFTKLKDGKDTKVKG